MNLTPELLAEATRAAAGPRPRFFDDPAMDQVWDVLLALTTELAVARTRLDSLERLLTAQGTLAEQALDSWQPEETVVNQQAQAHQALLARVYRALLQDDAAGG